ncbi:hypothetical protein BTS2_2704 [Bacillus sp. TS-2]|nr:hypothetical protein BTS2_2704 [Bacillus sp. TS-2]
MNKNWILLFCLTLVIFGLAGSYFYFTSISPLLAHNSDTFYVEEKEGQLVMLGNRSLLGSIKLDKVKVNQNQYPSEAFVIKSSIKEGLPISEFESHEKVDIEEVVMNRHANPQKQLEELRSGKLKEEEAVVHGLYVLHNEEINQILISYSILGISYEEHLIIP